MFPTSTSSSNGNTNNAINGKLQFPDCLTVRTATPRCDTEVAHLRLSVFSDLQAVGFLAAVAAALSAADVPCNAVAAFHHDHIFVPEGKANAAIAALQALARASQRPS